MVDSSRHPRSKLGTNDPMRLYTHDAALRIATESTVYDSADEIIVVDRLALVCSLADCVKAPCTATVDSSRHTK